MFELLIQLFYVSDLLNLNFLLEMFNDFFYFEWRKLMSTCLCIIVNNVTYIAEILEIILTILLFLFWLLPTFFIWCFFLSIIFFDFFLVLFLLHGQIYNAFNDTKILFYCFQFFFQFRFLFVNKLFLFKEFRL